MNVEGFGDCIRNLTKWNCPTVKNVRGFTKSMDKKSKDNVLVYVTVLNDQAGTVVGFQLMTVFLIAVNVFQAELNLMVIKENLVPCWVLRLEAFQERPL